MKLKQFLFILFLLIISAKQTYAQTVFEDNFSNGYEKWQDVRNTFDLWSIVNEQADVFVNKKSTLAELIPKNEFWNDSWKNYIYELDYTYLEGADKLLSFWFKDPLNWYQFHFVANKYILSHVKNGVEIWNKQEPLILEAGKKYKMEVHLNEGNIKFFIDGNQIFDVNDPTFKDDYGRIGIKSGAGTIYPTHVQFDNIKVSLISNLSDFFLNIKPIKQNDPLWKDINYDTATNWAKGKYTIADWGCLLTSINMVLDYYEIKTFPDGSLINPESLNQWLINQEDGFIGNGLVNWSAISRLVKEIHDIYGTVNLEYSRISKDTNELLNDVINEIKENKPVILEIPGHFLVSNGFLKDLSDIFITDPYYNYELFSQHNSQILSSRLLTPSNTDLSYIHISHDNNIKINVLDSSGNIPDNYQSYTEEISNISKDDTTGIIHLHEIAKPKTQNYIIKINSNKVQPYKIKLFTYDIDANLSNLSYSGIAGNTNNQTELVISFNKDNTSSISNNIDFNHFTNDVDFFTNSSQINKHYVAYELKLLAQEAQHSTIDKTRYINAIRSTINWYSEYIDEETIVVLNQRLDEIEKNL